MNLQDHLNREAVRYAVSRAIFCPDCGNILDMDDAVLVTGSERAGIACGSCFDATLERMRPVDHAAWLAAVAAGRVDVDDGRTLSA